MLVIDLALVVNVLLIGFTVWGFWPRYTVKLVERIPDSPGNYRVQIEVKRKFRRKAIILSYVGESGGVWFEEPSGDRAGLMMESRLDDAVSYYRVRRYFNMEQ